MPKQTVQGNFTSSQKEALVAKLTEVIQRDFDIPTDDLKQSVENALNESVSLFPDEALTGP